MARTASGATNMDDGPERHDSVSPLIAAIPGRRRGAPAGRRFRVPAAPCARSPARSATAAPDRRSPPASARAGRRCGCARPRRARCRAAPGGPRSGSCAGRSRPRPRIGSSTAITSAASVTKRRALLEQAVGAFGARIERGARHREHFAALFAGQPRGDQRAGAARRLHDHHAEREPGDQPVAARESRARAAPRRAAFPKRRRLRRGSIPADRHARPDRCGHGRRPARRWCRVARLARWAAASMPRARPDTMPKPASPRSRASRSREFDAGGGGVARADDGDQRPRQDGELAAHRQQRRRDRRSSAGAADNRVRRARRMRCRARAPLSVRPRPLRASRCAPARQRRRGAQGRAAPPSAARAPP